jgi:hypothetical protein
MHCQAGIDNGRSKTFNVRGTTLASFHCLRALRGKFLLACSAAII